MNKKSELHDENIVRLCHALLAFRERGNRESYHPVDTNTMDDAIGAVVAADEAIDDSEQAQVARLFRSDDATRTFEEACRKLVNLARALTDYDAGVHDALLYIDGHVKKGK
jgi:hypothetical protein